MATKVANIQLSLPGYGKVSINQAKLGKLLERKTGVSLENGLGLERVQQEFANFTKRELNTFVETGKKAWDKAAKGLDDFKRACYEAFKQTLTPSDAAATPQASTTPALELKPIKKDEFAELKLPEGYKLNQDKVKVGNKLEGEKFEVSEVSEGGVKLKALDDIGENTTTKVAALKDGKEEDIQVTFKTPQAPSAASSSEDLGWWKNWGGWVVPAVVGALVWLGTLVAGDSEKRGVGILGGIATFIAGLGIGGKFKWLHDLVGGAEGA